MALSFQAFIDDSYTRKGEHFSVLNGGKAIYFPSHGRQTEFKNQFSAVLSGLPK